MPTFIKTGFWDKLISNNPQQAKAPKGWLNLDNFVQTLIPPTPPPTPSTNIYNSDGTLTANRTLSGANNNLTFNDLLNFSVTQLGNDNGLKLDFNNNKFTLGNFDINPNNFIDINDNITQIEITTAKRFNRKTTFIVNDSIISSNYQNNPIGLKLDFANKTYELGQLTGNNATTLKIDDAAAFPVQVSGTNVTQNTSGAASGKFLKIKVGGVDYVIELKNPS